MLNLYRVQFLFPLEYILYICLIFVCTYKCKDVIKFAIFPNFSPPSPFSQSPQSPTPFEKNSGCACPCVYP